MTKIAVGSSSFGKTSNAPLELMKTKGIEVIVNPYGRKMTELEAIELFKDVDGVLAGLEPLNEKVISSCPNIKAISRIGVGMDNVDLSYAKKKGIKVSNTPDGPTDAVAEMTFAALLTIIHKIIESNEEIHRKEWKKHMGYSISELSIFFIGYGRIGRKTAELMRLMGAKTFAFDKYNLELSDCTLEEGLQMADVISLHASGTDCLISEEEIQMMKDGCILLNSARGGLIDENAVYDALKNGKISYYWADSHPQEPYVGKLIELKNAILTPHISTYTESCRKRMETQAVENLLRDLNV